MRRALTSEPEVALAPLAARMHRLADEERFEEAAATRDRLEALARALQRRRTVAMWRGVERLVVDCDGQRVEIRHGRRPLARRRHPDSVLTILPKNRRYGLREAGGDIAEILTVDRWVARNAGRLRLAVVDGELASALPRIVAGRTVP